MKLFYKPKQTELILINLALTVFCSTSIALILKYNDTKSGNAILLLAGNYLVASVISLFFYYFDKESQASTTSLMISAGFGMIFVLAFFAFTKAVNIAGTALATISSRLSVIVPVILSIILFNESPNIFHLTGFAFTLVTLYFFYLTLRKNKARDISLKDYLYLAAVLLGVGIADFGMKMFEQIRPMQEKSFFLAGIFGFAFIYSFAVHLVQRKSFDSKAFIRGNLLGIPNMFSSFFLIAALSEIKAIIVYPVVNIGIITLTALGAYLIWREKLNPYGIAALILGLLSIVLLSLQE